MNNDLVKLGKAILKANAAVEAARAELVKKAGGERLSRSDYRLLGVAKKIEALAETVQIVFDSEV